MPPTPRGRRKLANPVPAERRFFSAPGCSIPYSQHAHKAVLAHLVAVEDAYDGDNRLVAVYSCGCFHTIAALHLGRLPKLVDEMNVEPSDDYLDDLLPGDDGHYRDPF